MILVVKENTGAPIILAKEIDIPPLVTDKTIKVLSK